MRVPLPWAPDDFAALIRSPDAYTRIGPFRGSPALIVDARSAGAADLLRLRLPAGFPAVVVGIIDAATRASGELPAGLDVVAADVDDAQMLVRYVDRSPHAATVLAQLLRLQDAMTPLDALAAESLAYATLQSGDEFAGWLATRGARVRRPDATPRLRVEHRPDTATAVVTLDRPRVFNLYDAAMRDELVDAMRALVADETVERIELRGAGRAFCAGGDPAEFGTTRDGAVAHLIRSSANVAPLLLAAAPKLHAYVHGAAVGAGCELAAFAGNVVAAADATFSLPELGMGLVPGAGGTVSVTRRIGRHRAARFAITGDRIDAPTAQRWGLVDELS